MTHLRRVMLEELQRRHYSQATTQHYIRFVEKFAQHFHCSPDRLGRQHIREYQAQLFTVQKLSMMRLWFDLRQAVARCHDYGRQPPPSAL